MVKRASDDTKIRDDDGPFFFDCIFTKMLFQKLCASLWVWCMCIVYRRVCVVWKHCDAEPSSNKFVGSLYCIHIAYMAAAATAAFSVVECAFGVFVFELVVVLYEAGEECLCWGNATKPTPSIAI